MIMILFLNDSRDCSGYAIARHLSTLIAANTKNNELRVTKTKYVHILQSGVFLKIEGPKP